MRTRALPRGAPALSSLAVLTPTACRAACLATLSPNCFLKPQASWTAPSKPCARASVARSSKSPATPPTPGRSSVPSRQAPSLPRPRRVLGGGPRCRPPCLLALVMHAGARCSFARAGAWGRTHGRERGRLTMIVRPRCQGPPVASTPVAMLACRCTGPPVAPPHSDAPSRTPLPWLNLRSLFCGRPLEPSSVS